MPAGLHHPKVSGAGDLSSSPRGPPRRAVEWPHGSGLHPCTHGQTGATGSFRTSLWVATATCTSEASLRPARTPGEGLGPAL